MWWGGRLVVRREMVGGEVQSEAVCRWGIERAWIERGNERERAW
jgi:hypothetical protein